MDFAGRKDEQVKLKIFAIPWFSSIFYLFIIRAGGPMAQAPRNKLCLARCSADGTPAECLASQKAGHFPCGKSLVLLRAPADISAQRKFVIWLANKVRETNLFSSFGFTWIKKIG